MRDLNPTDRLISRREAAGLLCVKEQTLSKWAMTGRILPVVKIGRSARYRLSDVQRVVDQGALAPAGV
jgi:hypothetical protein